MKTKVNFQNLMIDERELYDEYLFQPTSELTQRMEDAREMCGEAHMVTPMYSATEPNLGSFWERVMWDQYEIALACERELVERGYETD